MSHSTTPIENRKSDSRPWFRTWLILNLSALILVVTFVFAPTRAIWDSIDVLLFKFFNQTLNGPAWWRVFWALLNHTLMDWVGDFIMIALFVSYIIYGVNGERRKRVAEFIFSVICIAALIYFVNRILFRENLKIPRLSPTLIFPESIRLSEWISWLKIKDTSTKSFPGDHATTAICFALCFSAFVRGRLRIWAWAYALLLSLPRVILGAHWPTDVIVGSGAISLWFYAWAFKTPFRSWAIGKIQKLFPN